MSPLARPIASLRLGGGFNLAFECEGCEKARALIDADGYGMNRQR